MQNNLNHILTKALLTLGFTALTGFTPSAFALSVKADPIAIRGCISKIPVASSKSIIDRYNYQLIGATTMETRSLGTTLAWIERLNGGKPFQPAIAHDGYGVRFREKKGHSAQRTGEIAINRNGALNYGENIAQLAHEIGHLVGNNGMYGDYRAAIGSTHRHPKYCKVSGYSDDKANEQFAEVFAAFVTRPELIKSSKDPVCKKAYAFFKRAFTNGALADKCFDAQNDVKQKLMAIADGVPSAKGAQSAESKERGMKASREDDRARFKQFMNVRIPPMLARPDAAANRAKPAPFSLLLVQNNPSKIDPKNWAPVIPYRLNNSDEILVAGKKVVNAKVKTSKTAKAKAKPSKPETKSVATKSKQAAQSVAAKSKPAAKSVASKQKLKKQTT